MMKIKVFEGILFLSIVLFCLIGCCPKQSEQKAWNDEIRNAYFVVEKLVSYEGPLLLKEQLVAMVGEPDLRVTPLELQKLLVDDASYRREVMNELWTDYLRAKKKRQDFHCVRGNDNWVYCEEFKKCSLWVYDESMRFDKPIDWGFWCANSGFTCRFFFLENSKIVGATYIAFWEPLELVQK